MRTVRRSARRRRRTAAGGAAGRARRCQARSPSLSARARLDAARSKQLRSPEVVQVQHASTRPRRGVVDDDQRRDASRSSSIFSASTASVSGRRWSPAAGGHDLARRADRESARATSSWRRRSPSVMMPASRPSASTTLVMPSFLRAHLGDDVAHRRVDRDPRQGLAGVHQRVRAHQALAQRAAGMQVGEVVLAEAAPDEQRHRQRVAERERRGRARRRRQIERARFLVDVGVEDDVGRLAQRRRADARSTR